MNEHTPDAKGTRWLEDLWQDARHTVRMMRRAKGFTAAAVLSLAVGIGANLAIFSVVDALLLRTLDVKNPHELFELNRTGFAQPNPRVSYPLFDRFRAGVPSLQFTAMAPAERMQVAADGNPELVLGQLVSGEWFDVLGVGASLGRVLGRSDDAGIGGHPVVVLSEPYWTRRFGRDPGVLGRTVTINGAALTVVGVSGPGFTGVSVGDRVDVWIPTSMQVDVRHRGNASTDDADDSKPWGTQDGIQWLSLLMRVPAGTSTADATSRVEAVNAQNLQARVARIQNPDRRARVLREHVELVSAARGDSNLRERFSQALVVLMSTVALVLLVACANLANLLLARATLRSREISVRAALGASRWRLVRQLLVESLLLSCLGGVAALLVGILLFRGILSQLPPFSLPPQAQVGVDFRVAAFLGLLTVLSALLFGLVPALQASRRDAALALKEGGRGGSASRRKAWLRNALVVSQVALAFVLVCGAGLLVRSFARLTSVEAGFDTTNVVTMGFLLQMDRDTDGERLTSYVSQVIDAVRAVPGVREAAMTSALPLQGWGFGMPFRVSGRSVEPSKRPSCFFKIVTPGYFGALGMKLRKGRGLSEADTKGSAPVVVVNEAFASRQFAAQDPICQHVLIEQIVTGKRQLGPEVAWQIVGVVADEKVSSLDNTSAGVYVSYAQSPIVGVSLLARGAGDPQALMASIRRAIWAVNRNQALPNPRTLEQIKSDSLGQNRLRTILIAAFAGLALSMAALGVYGVLSYVTAQRTLELGVRAALGASASDLVRLVVRAGSTSVLLGLIIGAYGAVGLTRWLREILFEVDPTDPATMALTAGVLILVGWSACYVPARRAAGVDPMTALRTE
jgi:predicted permease